MAAGHRALRLGVLTVAVALLVSGAGALAEDGRNGTVVQTQPAPVEETTTVPPTTAPPETTVVTTPPTTAAPEPVALDGSILALQQRLAELGYDIGTPDGNWGWRTHHTVMAFQKMEGLARTGKDNAELRAALARASRPRPFVPNGEPNRVEVDLQRQVLLLWKGGELARVLSVSTGNGKRYCVDGDCDTAITPTGSFRIGRKFAGKEVSRLGELFHPMYFYGGIAIHGSPSVPAGPASHGCVRVPMYAAASLFDQVPRGTAVYVTGNGPSASVVAPPPDKPKEQTKTPPPTEPRTPPPTDPPPTAPPATAAPTTTLFQRPTIPSIPTG
ncbi:MAG TPA: L,D-transpeptidase family protein [Acidimicrobiales bacterium]|nr:L,D-transpeptidase family protein [Acidimicrobiales bacterium]